MVSNSIISCCKDNICRIWTETVIPDDGLIQQSHFQKEQYQALNQQNDIDASPITSNGTNSTTTNSYLSNSKSVRHKRKLFNKLQKMRLVFFNFIKIFRNPF